MIAINGIERMKTHTEVRPPISVSVNAFLPSPFATISRPGSDARALSDSGAFRKRAGKKSCKVWETPIPAMKLMNRIKSGLKMK
jgi:hypothetical protein